MSEIKIFIKNMNTFIEKAHQFDLERKKYLELYTEKKQDIRIKEQINKSINFDSYFENKLMTTNELYEYGQTLESEYTKSSPTDNIDHRDGVPARLFDRVNQINFDLDLKHYSKYDHDRYRIDFNDEVYKQKNIDKNLEIDKMLLGENASENCQKVYFFCLEKILNFGFEIYGIKKDLSQYKNSTVSCLCGNTTPFVFYCKKNNYKFEISYNDDCDCIPGILYVESVIDCKTGDKIIVNCDLFSQNTPCNIVKNFIMLLSCENFNDFFEKRYGYISEMFNLVKKYYNSNFMDIVIKNDICINRFDFNVILDLLNSNGDKCLLIPYAGSNKEDYLIYLCPTLDDINSKNQNESLGYERENIDVNVFEMDMYPRFSFIYKSSDDLIELIKCIDCFMQYKKGNYGYIESGIYYNEKFIIDKFLKPLKDINLPNLYSRSNNYYGPDLDIVLEYMTADPFYACTQNHLDNFVYPLEKYQIRLFYDKKKDSDNCILTINGKWHDVTSIVKKYYDIEKKNNENNKCNFDMNLINDKAIEIANKYEFKGKFSECFHIIIQFLTDTTGEKLK